MLYVYPLVTLLYLLLPVMTLAAVLWARRRTGRRRPLRVLLRTFSLGAVLGGAVAMLYVSGAGAHLGAGQLLLAAYLGISALCGVSALNWIIAGAISRLFRVRSNVRGLHWRHLAAALSQAVLLMAVGLPYLGSVLFLYRPKAPSPGSPLTLIEATSYEVVGLRAADGTPLEAWWIPAARNAYSDDKGTDKQGRATVLFCHGFASDKGGQLFLVRDLVANGYNVLALDLRAHGRSAGQFTGLGGIESRDVLGAVRWLRAHRPAQSQKILGLGESLGAVALIEAAADPGAEGQAIDAIAAYNPYDDLTDVLDDASRQHTLPVGRWALTHLIVPVASAQLGSDLSGISPRNAVRALWPRPILILGNSTAHRSPLRGSFELYQDSLQPKYAYWRDDADRNTLLHDETAALTVRIFFDEAVPIL